MTSGAYRFGDFILAPSDRQLWRDDETVEINGRYLDALTLMVREPGKLISKDRFLDDVWRGVPVTDEALTQCIKTLRSRLGDSAAHPRFIETVPKHGYRFIAPVEEVVADRPMHKEAPAGRPASGWAEFFRLGGAGTLGGGLAGLFGGLYYGFLASPAQMQPGMGGASLLLVIVCLTILIALLGAMAVSFGIATARRIAGRAAAWLIVGGAIGGLSVGAIVKLIGLDAFNLLLGQSPGDVTGAAEGALLGGAVGLASWLAGRYRFSAERSAAIAALCGAAAGVIIILLGGTMMGGSLDLIARAFPDSSLRLDQVGALFGEAVFGPVSRLATGAMEAALFAAGIVGAMRLACSTR